MNTSVFFEDVRIFIKDLKVIPPIEYEIKHNFPFIKLHFVISGKTHYEPKSGNGIPITIEGGQYNFFYLPEVEGRLQITSTQITSIDIECDYAYFKRLFKSDFYKIAGVFGESIKENIAFKMWNKSPEFDFFLENKVSEIITCTKNKNINKLYLECLLKDTFRYLFAKMNTDGEKFACILSKVELNKVIQAEKILLENIKRAITVDELSALVGTNRHKLNRNFKKVHNEPVFSYFTRLRMEKAKFMLRQKNRTISEVSYEVGYKNPQHFTVAFKKHFGYVPSKLRN
ncbi:helix-turn-helix domain-containing protein [Formosa sediminum]|uniref:helix-turn-helix domain-containing protein n=1 Tax=Formosa sediminum TaxID=2594004 RepID=UPI00163D8185|nr:AraC family transcriptional regulator [Formosa sediminum]